MVGSPFVAEFLVSTNANEKVVGVEIGKTGLSRCCFWPCDIWNIRGTNRFWEDILGWEEQRIQSNMMQYVSRISNLNG